MDYNLKALTAYTAIALSLTSCFDAYSNNNDVKEEKDLSPTAEFSRHISESEIKENTSNNNFSNKESKSWYNMTHPSLEETVQDNVEKLVNDERYKLKRELSNVAKYENIIDKTAEEVDISEEKIKALIATESSGKLNAISNDSALGLTQLMQHTAEGLNVKINSFIDHRRNPEKAIPAGSKYLDKQYEEFENEHFSLIAYNGGPSDANDAKEKYGSSWRELQDHLNDETRNFVVRFLTREHILKNKEEYNISFEEPNITYTEKQNACKPYEVNNGETLTDIAEKNNVSKDSIKDFNPSLNDADLLRTGQRLCIPENKKLVDLTN